MLHYCVACFLPAALLDWPSCVQLGVRSTRHPGLTVVKKGWLEKKGGDTELLADGTLAKHRNLKRGGRRTWTRVSCVLLSNGVLLYYKGEAETSDNYRGCLVIGPGSTATEVSERASEADSLQFVVSASHAGAASATGESTKPSLLLRAANDTDSKTRLRSLAGVRQVSARVLGAAIAGASWIATVSAATRAGGLAEGVPPPSSR